MNKEILYAVQDFSWNSSPESCIEFATWGLNVIRALSGNQDLIPYTRGFIRDIYRQLIHADLRMEDFDGAAKHWQELKEAMQFL